MNKSIIIGYAVVAENSNGKFSGTIQMNYSDLTPKKGEVIAKIQTTKAHCQVDGKLVTIREGFTGTVLKKFQK